LGLDLVRGRGNNVPGKRKKSPKKKLRRRGPFEGDPTKTEKRKLKKKRAGRPKSLSSKVREADGTLNKGGKEGGKILLRRRSG